MVTLNYGAHAHKLVHEIHVLKNPLRKDYFKCIPAINKILHSA